MKPVDPLKFLIRFAAKKRGKAFSPEEVTLKAACHGVQVGDLRAWGGVFAQAARAGYIRRSEQLFSRTTSNGSVRPGWVGC
jgi:hypothetical protein